MTNSDNRPPAHRATDTDTTGPSANHDRPIYHPRHLRPREGELIALHGHDIQLEGEVEHATRGTGSLSVRFGPCSESLEYSLSMNGYGMVRIWVSDDDEQHVIWTGHIQELDVRVDER